VQRLENQQGVLEDDSFADREPMKLLHDRIIRPIDALDVLCTPLTRDLFGIAKFLFLSGHKC